MLCPATSVEFFECKEILPELEQIANDCELYPDLNKWSMNIPFGSKKKNIEHFCMLAQMQGYHINVKDFESIYGLV